MEQENKNEEQKEAEVKEQINDISQEPIKLSGTKNNMGKTIFLTILITIIVTGSFVFILYKYDQLIQAEQMDAQKEKTALENRLALLEKSKADMNDVKSGTNTAATNTHPAVQNNATTPSDANTVPGESGESEHAAPQDDDEGMRPAAEHEPHDAMNQNIGDTAGLYTMDIPADWVIKDNEGAAGMQVSRVIVESPDFAYHTDPTFEGPFEPSYYDDGAMFSVSVTQAQVVPSEPIGAITQHTQKVIDGNAAEYFVYTEPSTFDGELRAAIFSKDGNEYYFRFVYNPDSYPQGPDVFAQILDSVKL